MTPGSERKRAVLGCKASGKPLLTTRTLKPVRAARAAVGRNAFGRATGLHARESGGERMSCGVDLVAVDRIAESLALHGDRFLERLFTAREQADACGVPALREQRLAARFAAKEAAIKALGLVEVGLGWRDIEVVRHCDGACSLRLTGTAERQAAHLGLHDLALSLSHEGNWAIAMVQARFRTSISPAPAPRAVPTVHPRRTLMRATQNTTTAASIEADIRAVLSEHARLGKSAQALGRGEDLYLAGMSSHASVNVMLALEGRFDVEFPDHLLNRQVFSSVQAIESAVRQLMAPTGRSIA